jgi:hypothetical protein
MTTISLALFNVPIRILLLMLFRLPVTAASPLFRSNLSGFVNDTAADATFRAFFMHHLHVCFAVEQHSNDWSVDSNLWLFYSLEPTHKVSELQITNGNAHLDRTHGSYLARRASRTV